MPVGREEPMTAPSLLAPNFNFAGLLAGFSGGGADDSMGVGKGSGDSALTGLAGLGATAATGGIPVGPLLDAAKQGGSSQASSGSGSKGDNRDNVAKNITYGNVNLGSAGGAISWPIVAAIAAGVALVVYLWKR